MIRFREALFIPGAKIEGNTAKQLCVEVSIIFWLHSLIPLTGWQLCLVSIMFLEIIWAIVQCVSCRFSSLGFFVFMTIALIKQQAESMFFVIYVDAGLEKETQWWNHYPI